MENNVKIEKIDFIVIYDFMEGKNMKDYIELHSLDAFAALCDLNGITFGPKKIWKVSPPNYPLCPGAQDPLGGGIFFRNPKFPKSIIMVKNQFKSHLRISGGIKYERVG